MVASSIKIGLVLQVLQLLHVLQILHLNTKLLCNIHYTEK